MKLILSIFLLLLPIFIFSQKLENIDGEYQVKMKYSVDNKNVDFIYNNAYNWITDEFLEVKDFKGISSIKSRMIRTTVQEGYLSFQIEIICHDGFFISKFSKFRYKKRKIKKRHISDINKYLFKLCISMQYYIRYEIKI